MDADEAKKLTFSAARDGAKQILTLSTAILTITITFFKDFASGSCDVTRILMIIAWAFFLASIVSGVVLLFTLTGELNAAESGHTPSVDGKSSRISAGVQQVSFLIAIIATVVSGALALWNHTPAPTSLSTPSCATTSVPPVTQTWPS